MKENKQRIISMLSMILITISVFQIKSGTATIPDTPGAMLKHTVTEETNTSCCYQSAFVITGYCGCYQCCGIYSTAPYRPNGQVITASGKVAISGYTCASSYPFGTKFEITYQDGHKEVWECMDRGVSGNHLDLYYETHEQALRVGRQIVGVRVVEKSIY